MVRSIDTESRVLIILIYREWVIVIRSQNKANRVVAEEVLLLSNLLHRHKHPLNNHLLQKQLQNLKHLAIPTRISR